MIGICNALLIFESDEVEIKSSQASLKCNTQPNKSIMISCFNIKVRISSLELLVAAKGANIVSHR